MLVHPVTCPSCQNRWLPEQPLRPAPVLKIDDPERSESRDKKSAAAANQDGAETAAKDDATQDATQATSTEKTSLEETTGAEKDVTVRAKGHTHKPTVYIVAVMSNELKRNAALDHARLAEQIHEAIVGE